MKNTDSHNKNKIPRTLLYYYGIVILLIFVFNWLIMPMFLSRQVQTTTYFDFITRRSGEVKQVQFRTPKSLSPKKKTARFSITHRGLSTI